MQQRIGQPPVQPIPRQSQGSDGDNARVRGFAKHALSTQVARILSRLVAKQPTRPIRRIEQCFPCHQIHQSKLRRADGGREGDLGAEIQIGIVRFASQLAPTPREVHTIARIEKQIPILQLIGGQLRRVGNVQNHQLIHPRHFKHRERAIHSIGRQADFQNSRRRIHHAANNEGFPASAGVVSIAGATLPGFSV